MGIMARIVRIWKADIHGFMDRFEDHNLLLRQYLREMESLLLQRETALQQLGESAGKIKADLKMGEQERGKLEKDLAAALRKQKDNIARLLIRRQIIDQKQCEHLQRHYQSLLDEQKQLGELLQKQRLRYETLRLKAAGFLQSGEQESANRSFGFFNEISGACGVNEDEVEIELIRRKEQFGDKGACV